jgi:ribosomal protein S18 acetylase RimI-like enzyme
MKIRDAISSDVPAMYAVDHMAAEEGSRRQHIREWVSAGHAIVAIIDNIVVGYSVLNYTFFGYGFIAMLMVRKESRHKGVATALITYLEKRCETDKLFASTNESNKPMRALMQSMSYELSGTVYNLNEGDPELFYVKRIERNR